MNTADGLIRQLDLAPHPEGGWFRETWRAPCNAGERPASTAILFLLKSGDASHWHRVDADEIWLWQGGDALRLSIAESDCSQPASILLGPVGVSGHASQGVVPAGQWQG